MSDLKLEKALRHWMLCELQRRLGEWRVTEKRQPLKPGKHSGHGRRVLQGSIQAVPSRVQDVS